MNIFYISTVARRWKKRCEVGGEGGGGGERESEVKEEFLNVEEGARLLTEGDENLC